MGPEPRIAQIERVLRDWLEEPAITLVCGDWRRGSIMELYPEGRAVLSAERYSEPFAGLRDLHLVGQGHHLHLDLAKLSTAVYTVAPSVCYGYRPSFEVRFTGSGEGAAAGGFALCVREPYRGGHTNRAALVGYFRRMLEHQSLFPLVTRFHVDPRDEIPHGLVAAADVWRDARACLVEARRQARSDGPTAEILDDAAPFAHAAEVLLAKGCDG